MQFLKQATAYTLRIGPFVDNGDGFTPETGLTISQADVRLSKAHADWAQKTEATSCTHNEAGWYDCPVDATDTGTVGPLALAVNESGALPVWHEYTVLPANVYDSLFAGTDYLQVDLKQQGGIDLPAGTIPPAAAGASGGLALTLAGLVNANLSQINGSAAAALALQLMYDAGMTPFVVDAAVDEGDWTAVAGALVGTDDYYTGCYVVFCSGANKGEVRVASNYTGSTKQFEFTGTGTATDRPFIATPSAGDVGFILGIG